MKEFEGYFKRGNYPQTKLSQLELFLRVSQKKGLADLLLLVDRLKDLKVGDWLDSKYDALQKEFRSFECDLNTKEAFSFLIGNGLVHQQYGHGGDNYDYQIPSNLRDFILEVAKHISNWQKSEAPQLTEVIPPNSTIKKPSQSRIRKFALIETLSKKTEQRRSHLIYRGFEHSDIDFLRENNVIKAKEEDVEERVYQVYIWNSENTKKFNEKELTPEIYRIIRMFDIKNSYYKENLIRRCGLKLGDAFEAIDYLLDNGFIYGEKPVYNDKKVTYSLTEKGQTLWQDFFRPLRDIIYEKSPVREAYQHV